MGYTSNQPPTQSGRYIVGGPSVSFYGTPKARKAFLADPGAVSAAMYIFDNAQTRSYNFTKRAYGVNQTAKWQEEVEKVETYLEARIRPYKAPTTDSVFSMEMVRDPKEDWKGEHGVSAVKYSTIQEVAVENQRRAIAQSERRFEQTKKADQSHAPSSKPNQLANAGQ